ncbi:MAG TPA: hypothetical protein VEH62_05610 [Gemmatimonadales bacterium]|nr:hypothetical protein [Gemmatimonadales bacterium]
MRLDSRATTLAVRIVAILAVATAGWLLMHVYSGGPSYSSYLAPAHAFLRATLAADSAGLVRQRADPAVVQWALHQARQDSSALRDLERELYLGSGSPKGESTLVWFDAPTRGACVRWSLVLSFVGRGRDARIGRAAVRCSVPVTPPPGAGRTTGG